MMNVPRPCVSIEGEFLTHGEVESLRCAVTALHSEMSDPLALGDDEHGRAMVRHYPAPHGADSEAHGRH